MVGRRIEGQDEHIIITMRKSNSKEVGLEEDNNNKAVLEDVGVKFEELINGKFERRFVYVQCKRETTYNSLDST